MGLNALQTEHVELAAAERAEAARLLGFELAQCGMPLGEDMPAEVEEGYREACYSGQKNRKAAGTFERKLLRLKISAWRRGRYVDTGVTPEFLAMIATDYCPVTRVAMTSGTNSETDMTLDRVFNGGAYAVGNIAAMSAVANHAKGGLAPLEILDLAKKGGARGGLGELDWWRMACLTCMATPPGYPISHLPLLVMPPNGLLISNGYVVLQKALTLTAAGFMEHRFKTELRAVPKGKRAKRAFDALLEVLGATTSAELSGCKDDQSRKWALCDAWLPPLVLERYRQMVRELSASEVTELLVRSKRGAGTFRDMSMDDLKAWGVERGGYEQ